MRERRQIVGGQARTVKPAGHVMAVKLRRLDFPCGPASSAYDSNRYTNRNGVSRVRLVPERWLSGRKRRFAKPVSGVNPDHGFESRPLRSAKTYVKSCHGSRAAHRLTVTQTVT